MLGRNCSSNPISNPVLRVMFHLQVEERRSTLDRFLDRQETAEDKIFRLDAVLDQQATE